MPSIGTTTPADLRRELGRIDGWRTTRRLVAALLYACGYSGPEIAAVFDVRAATVYAWLDRFEGTDDLRWAATDRPRSGRPRRLDPDERAALAATLHAPPVACGYSSERWTPRLVRRFLAEELGVEYSVRHARRLLTEARDEDGEGERWPDAS